jgi:Protein of unknown function (DUF4199)
MSKKTSILQFGTLAGLIVAVPLFGIATTMQSQMPSTLGVVIGILAMLVAFSFIFIAIKQERDRSGGGVIRFWPAFGMGLAITAIASVFYVVAWEAALAVTGMDFAGDYAASVIAQHQAQGASASEVAALSVKLEAFKADYANPFYRVAITLTEIAPVGIIVSLVSAALLRNARFLPARRIEQPSKNA